MLRLTELVKVLSTELDIAGFTDTSLNGLQIEGREEVRSVAAAVDAGLSVVRRAVDGGHDVLLVHHGLFWQKPVAITGPAKELIRIALEGGLSVFAAHLPLDAHDTLGNNVLLARRLGLTDPKPAVPHLGRPIGCIAANGSQVTLEQLAERCARLPGATGAPLVFAHGPDVPGRVCLVTGSGAEALNRYEQDGFDTFITGEPRQFTYHFTKERRLNAIFAGHYATETFGVCELGRHIETRYGIPWTFIDEPTGI